MTTITAYMLGFLIAIVLSIAVSRLTWRLLNHSWWDKMTAVHMSLAIGALNGILILTVIQILQEVSK